MPTSQQKSTISPRPTKASALRMAAQGSTKKPATAEAPTSEMPKKQNSGVRASEGVRAFMAQQRARVSAKQPSKEEQVEKARSPRVMTGAMRYSSVTNASREEAFGQSEEKPNLKLKTLIRQAKSSGTLNISGRGLERLPEEVMTMYHVDPNSIVVDFTSTGDAWYDQEVLQKFIAADNGMVELDERISTEFSSLQLLDLRNNSLLALPTSLNQLKNLTVLQLPHNKFEAIPPPVLELQQLRQLYLSHNQISTLASDIRKLVNLDTLDLSSNQLPELPNEICQLPSLRKLNLDGNRLTRLPSLDVPNCWTKLNDLSLSQNRLEILFEATTSGSVSLPSLSHLSVCDNRLKHILQPEIESAGLFVALPKLTVLNLAHNCLSSLAIVEAAPEIETLTIGSNQFTDIPDAVLTLQHLKRLDVSFNQLQDLRPDLATLPELQTINWDGNKLRSVPRNITMTDMMNFLREKLVLDETRDIPALSQSEEKEAVGEPQDELNSKLVPSLVSPTSPSPSESQKPKERKNLNLSRKQLEEVSEEMIQQPAHIDITTIDLSHNLLTLSPSSLLLCAETLVNLDLSHNHITEFSSFSTCVFGSLKSLNLANNSIRAIEETSSFPVLKELNLCHNRIESLPDNLCEFLPSLRVLKSSSNKLDEISAKSFQNLEILDLSCNDIGRLPPELGLIKSLKELELHGNRFRIPRPSLLSQGTQAVMEFLRQRANPSD